MGEYDDEDDEYWTGEFMDDGDDDSKSSIDGKRSSAGSFRPSNHSEIEKRRRDKMNHFISEIATMVPACAGMSRRMDKLSVLRLAAQHIRSLKGSFSLTGRDTCKPAYISDEELRDLILQNFDGLMMSVSCDSMKIFYVGSNAQEILGMNADDLIGQNFLCLIHSGDLESVKSQIMWQNVGSATASTDGPSGCGPPREWSVHRTGANRSFYCRIRCSTDDSSSRDPQYCTVHCRGFIKLCSCSSISNAPYSDRTAIGQDTPGKLCDGSAGLNDEQSCLILLIKPVTLPFQFDDRGLLLTGTRTAFGFTSQHSQCGRFIRVDHTVTAVLGYLPQELVRVSYHDFVHKDDIALVNDVQKKALDEPGKHATPRPYRLRAQTGAFVQVSSSWSSFRNRWNGEFQFMVVWHKLVPKETSNPAKSDIGNTKLVTLTQLLLAKDGETLPRPGQTNAMASSNRTQWPN